MTRPWSQHVATQACEAFIAQAALKETRAELISFRQNAIFHLADSNVSLRVYGPHEAQDRAAIMVDCARSLEAQGFPAVRLADVPLHQPADVHGYRLSVWQWIKQDEAATDTAFLFGRLLRRLHDLPGNPDLALPSFDPLSKIGQRIARLKSAATLDADGLAVLEAAFGHARQMEGRLRHSRLREGLIHGDAIPSNSIRSGDEMVLIDLDSACHGPREWDLVPMAVNARRFARDNGAAWRDFLTGYGIDEASLPELEAAEFIKQLSMTVFLCLSYGQSAAIDTEISRRLLMWKQGDRDGRWRSGFQVAKAGIGQGAEPAA